MKKEKGFTLVELLVVVAIVGLLATIIIISLNSARGKARDAHRKTQLRHVQDALELYYDQAEVYPAGLFFSVWDSEEGHTINYWSEDPVNAVLYNALVGGGYLSQLPLDPVNKQGGAWNILTDGPPLIRDMFIIQIMTSAIY